MNVKKLQDIKQFLKFSYTSNNHIFNLSQFSLLRFFTSVRFSKNYCLDLKSLCTYLIFLFSLPISWPPIHSFPYWNPVFSVFHSMETLLIKVPGVSNAIHIFQGFSHWISWQHAIFLITLSLKLSSLLVP